MKENKLSVHEALKEDFKKVVSMKTYPITAWDFYTTLGQIFFKFFFLLSFCNFVVLYLLSSKYVIYIPNMYDHVWMDMILPNFWFSIFALLYLSQLYVFKKIYGKELSSFFYFKKVLNVFELVFFILYLIFYTLCVVSEGDIFGSYCGSSICAFFLSALLIGLIANMESQRVAWPLLFDLIHKITKKKDLDRYFFPKD